MLALTATRFATLPSAAIPAPRAVHKEIQEINHRIARMIPFYPDSIQISTLARMFGLTNWKLEQRIDTVQDAYLIVEDDCRRLSRLHGDLSNMEAMS